MNGDNHGLETICLCCCFGGVNNLAPGFDAVPDAPGLSAEAGRQRLFRDLADTLAAFASDRGLFILLDDLQWSDELTLAFLESLPASYFEENAVVFLGTWRSEEATDALRRLAALPHADAFELTRMDEAAVGSLEFPTIFLVCITSIQMVGNEHCLY